MFIFGNIAKDLKNIAKVLNSVSREVYLLPDTEFFLIQTLKERLYKKGVDKNEIQIRTDKSFLPESVYKVYARSTEKRKIYKGLPFTNVSLFQSGNFYKSMGLMVLAKSYKINANFIKNNKLHISRNFKKTYKTKKHFELSILSMTKNETGVFVKTYFTPKFNKQFKIYLSNIIRKHK
jgi:hypothetical protein